MRVAVVSMHRFCCCAPALVCPEGPMTVTVSGVTACGCTTWSGGFDYEVKDVNIDGTYQLDFVTGQDDECIYSLDVDDLEDPTVVWETAQSNDMTCSFPDGFDNESHRVVITVRIGRFDLKVKRVTIIFLESQFFFRVLDGNFDLGSTIHNDVPSCSDPNSSIRRFSDDGTVVATLP